MNIKLTLKLDKDAIEQAKLYAQHRKQSLSRLVENYFRFLIDREQKSDNPDISPSVQQLSGIIEPIDAKQFRENYTDHLTRKYQS